MHFDWYILGTILSGISSVFFGCLVYFNNKDKIGKVFLAFSFSFAFWTIPYAIWLAQSDPTDALFWARVLNLGATFIPILYIHWVVLVLKKVKEHRKLLSVGYIATIIYAFFSFSPLYIDRVASVGQFPFWPQANFLYISFLFTILLPFFGYGIYLLAKAYFSRKTDEMLKVQSKYMLIGSIMSTVGGTANFFLMFGIPFIAPQFTLLTIFQSMFWAYGSLQHKIFNVKTIATEILVSGLWIFILVRTVMFEKRTDQLIEGILLLVTIVFGIYLIKSVNSEVKTREKVELLAEDLQKANVHLLDLNRQKSEFVSFATHQLRAPLTAMKGYASLILEGDMGEVSAKVREGVSRMYESTNTLVSIVNDYLNLSRIELGSMKYAFETIDLRVLIEDTIAEIKPNIEKTGIAFSFHADGGGIDYRITADKDKLKQVIANVLDNSLKYTPRGSITASLSLDKNTHKFVFSVKDTGVGIARETLPLLFKKFSRAENANKTNIRGTGLGLYVAKQMIEAHHGTIRAESEGEGKGSTFTVELEPFAKA
ncbi:MAG: ATP-binding protein [Bacteroidota bacterium]